MLGATGRRDRLYSSLSMMRGQDPSLESWGPSINYNANSVEIFSDLAVRYLERQDSNILKLAGRWKQKS